VKGKVKRRSIAELIGITSAGDAEIQFDTERVTPKREGKVITLPLANPRCEEFYPLVGGRQFLYHSSSGQLWFGGTEEKPFLVELNPTASLDYLGSYLADGEEGFFDLLRPRFLKRIESDLGITAKRQGDIFALRLTGGWADSELKFFMRAFEMSVGSPKPQAGNHFVFETRHKLQGEYILIKLGQGTDIALGAGVLMNPDHTTMRLEDGIYLMQQTAGLMNPKQAD